MCTVYNALHIRYLLDVKECIYAKVIHFTNRKQTVNWNQFIHHFTSFILYSLWLCIVHVYRLPTGQLSSSQWCHCFSETFRFIREWTILLSPDSKIDVRRAWSSPCTSKPVDTNQTFKSFWIVFFSLCVSLLFFLCTIRDLFLKFCFHSGYLFDFAYSIFVWRSSRYYLWNEIMKKTKYFIVYNTSYQSFWTATVESM